MNAQRVPDESNDSVHLVVSLLVRHPEISRVIIKPRFAAMALFFIVRGSVGKEEEDRFRESMFAHVRAFQRLTGGDARTVAIRVRSEETLTFVDVERDAQSLSRDEIPLIVGVVAQWFGDRLMVNPPAEDPGADEFAPPDDSVGPALDAVRRAKQRNSLIGFREERRVLVIFGK